MHNFMVKANGSSNFTFGYSYKERYLSDKSSGENPIEIFQMFIELYRFVVSANLLLISLIFIYIHDEPVTSLFLMNNFQLF